MNLTYDIVSLGLESAAKHVSDCICCSISTIYLTLDALKAREAVRALNDIVICMQASGLQKSDIITTQERL